MEEDFSPVDDSGLFSVFFLLLLLRLLLLLLACRLFQNKNWLCGSLYFLPMLEKSLCFVLKKRRAAAGGGIFKIGAVNEPGEETDLMFV